ncbi:hypothetical protein K9M50_00790 [Patescibacteria group bacterium]|nr:hypothetical protein [Patescibacteria group bacterium]
MNKNKIDKILQDLYKIDPELKKQEKELIKIIKKLLASKPEVKIDQSFVKDLRKKLLQGGKKQVGFKINYMNKFIYAGIGMAVMALVLIPYYTNKNNNLSVDNILKDNGIKIESVEEKAFGSLGDISSQNANNEEGANRAGGDASVMGLGSAEMSAREGTADDRISIMPMPTPVMYEYKYVGDSFDINKDSTNVIKRVKDSDLSAENAMSLNSLGIGGISYSNFDKLKVDNISLYEDKDSGYIVSIDSGEQKISIYKNWQTWPQEDGLNERLKISDIPNDDNIIAIADNFVESYNLDMSPYGEAVVNKSWLKNYERAENKESVYIPQTMTVIYPLIINDKEVYNEYNNKYGLSVQVDIKNNKVSSVNEIINHNYQSSNYEVVQDEARLIDIAERGGYRNYSYNRGNEDVEKKIVELGTPSLEMVRVWKYSPNGSEELYIESYIFPVINSEDSNFYRDYLIVPIVEDLIKEDEKKNNNTLNNIPEPYIGIPEQSSGSAPTIQPRDGELPMIQEDLGVENDVEIQVLN